MNLTQRQMQIANHVKEVKAGLIKKRAIPFTLDPSFPAKCPVCGYDYGKCEVVDWQAEFWNNPDAYQETVEAWNSGKPYQVSCLWCGSWLIADEEKKTLEVAPSGGWLQWSRESELCYTPKENEVSIERRQAPVKVMASAVPADIKLVVDKQFIDYPNAQHEDMTLHLKKVLTKELGDLQGKKGFEKQIQEVLIDLRQTYPSYKEVFDGFIKT